MQGNYLRHDGRLTLRAKGGVGMFINRRLVVGGFFFLVSV